MYDQDEKNILMSNLFFELATSLESLFTHRSTKDEADAYSSSHRFTMSTEHRFDTIKTIQL